jgi:uncharacterized membrane protein
MAATGLAVLREKMTRNLWIGVILICLRTILESGT